MKMKKTPRIMSIIVFASVMFAMMSFQIVWAEGEPASYDLWVSGIQVTDDNKANVLGNDGTPTVSFDSNTNTLTLDNATINSYSNYEGNDCAQIISYMDLTIKLKGNNVIRDDGPRYIKTGLLIKNSKTTITGTGSLTVDSRSVKTVQNGIHVLDGGLEIESGTIHTEGVLCGLLSSSSTVDVNGGTFSACGVQTTGVNRPSGIRADLGSFTIDGADVTATSDRDGAIFLSGAALTLKSGSLTVDSPQYAGICHDPSSTTDKYANIKVSGGTLDVKSQSDNGITLQGGSFEMTDGVCKFTGADGKRGMQFISASLTISGGDMTATGTAGGIDYGNALTMNGGSLKVTGTNHAIQMGGSLEVNGGFLDAESSDGDAIYRDSSGHIGINGGLLHAKGNRALRCYCGSNQETLQIADNCGIIVPTNGYIKHSTYAFIVDPTTDTETKEVLIGAIPIDLSDTTVKVSNTAFTYNGKTHIPTVSADFMGTIMEKDTDYTVTCLNSKGTVVKTPQTAGNYTLKVDGVGNYSGTFTKAFQIKKAVNPMVLNAKTATVKYSKLKKKAQTIKRVNAVKISNAQGTKSYKYVSAKKSKKSFKKYFKVNAKTGTVTVKKGLKKGTYKVTVKVKAAGNTNYKESLWKAVTFKVKVK